MEEEVRKTTVPKVRRTKCRRDPGPGRRRNSGTSDLYFTCSPASRTQSSTITTYNNTVGFSQRTAQKVKTKREKGVLKQRKTEK